MASHVPTGVIKSADYMIMIEDNTVRTISMFRDWSLADIGKKLSSRVYTNIPRLPIYRGRQLLEVKNFSVGKLENVEFSLAQGEIIGLYNNRRSEIRKIFEMIAGLRIAGDGDIRFYPDRQHIKIGYLPEQDTVFDHMALPQNVTISNLDAVKKLPFIIDLKQEQIIYNDYAHRLGIRSKTKAPSKLSKGNRQKIMLARCLHSKCNLYLMDNPTNSLDSSSKIEFYNILAELSHRKAGILIASSNINELFYLCDRLLIVKDETDLRSFNTADTTLETLMYSI